MDRTGDSSSSHLVAADFSQFYVRGELGYFVMENSVTEGPGLAVVDGHGSVMLVAFRQFGDLAVDVEVREGPPDPLGEEWTDIVEVGITASASTLLTGWEPSPDDLVLDLTPGLSYRVQYAIANGDLANAVSEPPYSERYRLRFWPSPEEPSQVIRGDSATGQYWNFQRFVAAARDRVAVLAPGSGPTPSSILHCASILRPPGESPAVTTHSGSGCSRTPNPSTHRCSLIVRSSR